MAERNPFLGIHPDRPVPFGLALVAGVALAAFVTAGFVLIASSSGGL